MNQPNAERIFRLPGIHELSKQQDAALSLSLEGQHLIIGGPGTGKSVVALLRARRLAKAKSAYTFLVYNHVLNRSNAQFSGGEFQLDASTWDAWFRAIYGTILGQPIPTLPSPTSYKPIDWVCVLSAIQQLPNERLPKALPSLVIDEGQDMPLTFYRALVALGFSNFYVVADQNQQLHPDRCSTRQEIEGVLGLDVDDTIELKHNYRNPLPVALLARAFYTGDPASPPPELPAASESVWTPRLLHYGRQGDPSFEQILARILKLSDRNRRKLVGVITPNNRSASGSSERFWRLMLTLITGGLRSLPTPAEWGRSGFLDRQGMPGLSVCLADSIAIAARRAGLERFDALIVDEGQDVLNMESLAKLDAALHGGLETGRWCFFHDANNQSGLCGTYVPDAYDYLSGLGPTKVPLKTNCRNTLQILEKVKGRLGADLGVSGIGDGPAVREQVSRDAQHSAEMLSAELDALIEREGIAPSEIVVLSPHPLTQSSAASLVDRRKPVLAEMDSYSPRAGGRALPGFAQIGDFKGLESEVVVLIDMPTPRRNSAFSAQHYVGMSRARVLLSIISAETN